MIKNESKIIERCLERALEHVDAISILDTGSTDNTIELCQKYLENCGKPFKISVEPFRNFGYNRTISFQKTVDFCRELEWDLDTTYSMAVDADMIIKPSPEFKNFKMSASGYKLIQQNGSLKYYNIRFMKCGYNWKCIGVTHEYWSGDPVETIPYEIFYICDIGDGGCKSDKFERDIRLFLEDLKIDPTNARTHFYLAQSYKDSGKFQEAIQYYKKRIKLGGWYEEVWYSHYQIAKCYEHLKLPEKMETWALKAFKFHPQRSEPLYYLTDYFKNNYEHFKAYQYYLKGKHIPFPKNDQLFIEYNIYNGLFDYQATIINYYIFNKTKQDALNDIVTYINTKSYYIDNVWNNIKYYTEALISKTYNAEYIKLFFPKFDEYEVSSCSIIPYKNQFLMNTRLVNYYINSKGEYHTRIPNNNIKTKNGFTFLNNSYYPKTDIQLIKENINTKYDSNVEGLEDVRIFLFNNDIYFTATTKNLSIDNKFHIVIGNYNIDNSTIDNVSIIESPRLTNCEKNWIYIPDTSPYSIKTTNNKMNFIYNWHPLEIGSINNSKENKKLEIHTTINTPNIFSRFRGSSNMCEYNQYLWCVVHIVLYHNPRKYLHSVIAFNHITMKPEMYSLPFTFKDDNIEYCIGFHINNEKLCFIFSQNDSNPGIITIPRTNLYFIQIN